MKGFIDFKVKSNLDFDLQNNEYRFNDDGASSIICALLTDGRMEGDRGYPVEDVLTSRLWTMSQDRHTVDGLNETLEIANICTAQLVGPNKEFEKIDVTGILENDKMYLVAIGQTHVGETVEEEFIL